MCSVFQHPIENDLQDVGWREYHMPNPKEDESKLQMASPHLYTLPQLLSSQTIKGKATDKLE